MFSHPGITVIIAVVLLVTAIDALFTTTAFTLPTAVVALLMTVVVAPAGGPGPRHSAALAVDDYSVLLDSLFDSLFDSPFDNPVDNPFDRPFNSPFDSPFDTPLQYPLQYFFDSRFDSPADSPVDRWQGLRWYLFVLSDLVRVFVFVCS